MPQSLRRLIAGLLALMLLLLGLLLTVSHWLPRLAGIWLPADTRIALEQSPRWSQRGITFPQIQYLVQDCVLASVQQARLGRQAGRWQLDAERIAIDSRCLQKLPAGESSSTPFNLAEWQQRLPAAEIHLATLSVAPWQSLAGELHLRLDRQQQTLEYRGEQLKVSARLHGQQLNVSQLWFTSPLMPEPITLSGSLAMPGLNARIPPTGDFNAALNYAGQPLRLALNWQQQRGTLVVSQPGVADPLLILPWHISAEQIRLTEGRYRWPYSAFPLSGNVALTLDNWQQGLEQMRVTGRLNLLTRGRGGRGNAVLAIGPGKVSLTDSALPLRLTGDSKLADMQLYAALPGLLQGAISDPQLSFQPGALLRLRGRLLSTLEVDEARWPLSGVKLASQGVSGRLKAILTAHDAAMGTINLHLDGRAENFWPDKGAWNWRYWGGGKLRPVNADWRIHGTGGWHDTLIHLDTLDTRFSQMQYGSVHIAQPRLQLSAPVSWQRDTALAVFNGEFRLTAGETHFSYGGHLPASTLTFTAAGRDPRHFVWRGQLQARDIGPLRVHGRWDGERLRGEAWWPKQSLTVFQPLLKPDWNMQIHDGQLRAQMAFSAAPDEGFRVGGHWVVSNGSLWLPDNQINGVSFSLPFRFARQQWQLGVKGPVSLRIDEITNQFALQNVRADLQGYYPWSEKRPLRLQDVSLDLLDGNITLPALRLPQHDAAIVSLRELSLSKLVTALKPKQFAMSGRIGGELPLWVNNSRWLIENGWIANHGYLTFRLDKDMADAITADNVAAGAALNWLRYMEISRSRASINLDNLGNLTMQAAVAGVSQFSNRRQTVQLNYHHQQNLFQFWRSLRFGDNLQSWVEQNATLPSTRDQQP